jgi:hypothetical protein
MMRCFVERSKLVAAAQGRRWIRHADLKERAMAIGPVQLIVLGFEQREFHGEIAAELEQLRESDTVGVFDALAAGRENGHA